MAATDRVRLLDTKLGFARHLAPDERADIAGITLPVVDVARGPLELDSLLRAHSGFAATVLDGMLVHALTIGDQSGISTCSARGTSFFAAARCGLRGSRMSHSGHPPRHAWPCSAQTSRQRRGALPRSSQPFTSP